MGIDWRRLPELLSAHQSFVLTSHMRPDCDALGSELAFASALRALGKDVRVINGDGVPPHVAFIDPDHEVLVLGEDVTPADAGDCDAMVVLDTSAWTQLGPMGDVLKGSSAAKLVIDHHVSSDDLGAVEFKDSQAEATGRLVLEACEALGVKVTPAMATALFAAIATDTGWFRFSSVTAATYAAASQCVAAGANPASVFSSLYEQHSLARLHLHGRIQARAQTELDDRLIYCCVRQTDFAETGAQMTDTEDVVNRLMSVAGVEVAVLLLEIGPHRTKGSLRSRSGIDVCRVAEQFGGGGHKAAAGVRDPGPIDDAQRDILEVLRQVMG